MSKNISYELQLVFEILRSDVNSLDYHKDINLPPQKLLLAINWDEFIALIIKHRLIPQAYNYLKGTGSAPDEILGQISDLCQKVKMHNLAMLCESIRITRLLQVNDIKYIIVKGIPLASVAYQDYSHRQAKDIDILIAPEDLEKAQNLLQTLGFTLVSPKYNLHGFKKSYHLTHKHEITFFNARNNVEVELHFTLNYLGVKFFDLNDIPQEHININNHTIITAISIFHFTYIMLHGAIHAFSRLRWLHDIALYIKNTDINLTKVFALAKILHVEHIMLQTLILLKEIYEIDHLVVDELILKYKTHKAQDLANIALEFIIADYEIGNNHGAFNKMFYRYRLYIVKLAISGRKFNTFIGDFFKIEKTFDYITLPKYMSFGYYLLYPLILVRYFRK